MEGGQRGAVVRPAVAGVVSALVGYGSSFAVVLAGLRAVGADTDEATGGLVVASFAIAAGGLLLGIATRKPVLLAWSTPGAALLATAAAPSGGFPEAVGALLLAGLLLLATGLVPGLAALVQRVPTTIASAMLAGVLLGLCVQPFRLLAEDPLGIGAVLAVWAVLQRLAPRFAVLGALGAAVVVFLASGSAAAVRAPAEVLPHPVLVAPVLTAASALSLALPLFLVTMTSQNIPGAAVLRSFGWSVPWRPALVLTGGASAVGALAGGFTVNLAAITAALVAGPDAGPDRDRRWIGAVANGAAYVVLGALGPLVVAVAAVAPAGLVPAFAGIALLGALGGAVVQALDVPEQRVAAVTTLAVAASGVVLAGLGAPFWALVAGCALVAVTRTRHAPPAVGGAPIGDD